MYGEKLRLARVFIFCLYISFDLSKSTNSRDKLGAGEPLAVLVLENGDAVLLNSVINCEKRKLIFKSVTFATLFSYKL